MISILRTIITIAMLVLLIIQIYYLIKEKSGKCLLSGAIIQILNIVQLILRYYE